jgi:CheY-like chemotaxis protein
VSDEACILIVDDDHETRELTSALLESHGYTVATAGNGCQALELLRAMARKPALVLLDEQMPLMTGSQLLDRMGGHAELATIRVVLVSASGRDDPRVVERLHKPVQPERLLELVERLAPRP